jgi:membrane protein YqaA with SNARE-associated domain
MHGLSDYSLWGLFIASFLSATFVPFSSEAVLSLVIIKGTAPMTAILVASTGNVLGGMTSFTIGYLGKWEWIVKYLHIKRETIEKWHKRIHKRGAIIGFFCWVPGIGDVIAVALGLLRTNIYITAVSMLIGKFLRYVVWAWLTGIVF